ncbi:MAG: transcriptional regulator [Oscillospiraceae bacterium]|nr:transcriptional regulator [Oscillospiraceae bacterium]
MIRAIIGLRGTSIAQLATALGTSRQNLTSKLKRNNFSETELRQIADILNYDLILQFKERQ